MDWTTGLDYWTDLDTVGSCAKRRACAHTQIYTVRSSDIQRSSLSPRGPQRNMFGSRSSPIPVDDSDSGHGPLIDLCFPGAEIPIPVQVIPQEIGSVFLSLAALSVPSLFSLCPETTSSEDLPSLTFGHVWLTYGYAAV